MGVVAAGAPAPGISLQREDGSRFTNADLEGATVVLVFFPAAFSPVCTDQFQVYEEAIAQITAGGAEVYGVSTDNTFSQIAFRETRGISTPMLSDFEPKGAVSRALGVYFEPGGVATRALIVLRDGVVAWSWEGQHPGVLPGVNLIFDGLAAAKAA